MRGASPAIEDDLIAALTSRPMTAGSNRSGRPSSSRSAAFTRPEAPPASVLEQKARDDAAELRAQMMADFTEHAREWKRTTGLRVIVDNEEKREKDSEAALRRIHEICTSPASLCHRSTQRDLASAEKTIQVPGPSTGTGGKIVGFTRWPGTAHMVREFRGHGDKAVLSCAVDKNGEWLITCAEVCVVVCILFIFIAFMTEYFAYFNANTFSGHGVASVGYRNI